MKVVRFDVLQFIPASHESRENPGVLKKILFERDDLQSGRVQMINWAKLAAGKSFSSHYHEDMQEVFVIVSGSARMQVGDESIELESGDSILIVPGAVHKMSNLTEGDVEYVVIGISSGQGGKTVVVE